MSEETDFKVSRWPLSCSSCHTALPYTHTYSHLTRTHFVLCVTVCVMEGFWVAPGISWDGDFPEGNMPLNIFIFSIKHSPPTTVGWKKLSVKIFYLALLWMVSAMVSLGWPSGTKHIGNIDSNMSKPLCNLLTHIISILKQTCSLNSKQISGFQWNLSQWPYEHFLPLFLSVCFCGNTPLLYRYPSTGRGRGLCRHSHHHTGLEAEFHLYKSSYF